MPTFLHGFTDELIKLSALTDGLNSGEGEGANLGEMGTGNGNAFPPMEQVSNKPYKSKRGKIDFRAPKPPKVPK